MRILFVKLGSIGDIVHTLPALAAVRKQLPDAAISWVAERRSAEILRENTLIESLIEVDTRSLRSGKIVAQILPSLREQFRALRREKFDVAIDFQGLIKSAAIAKLSGAKKRYGFDRDSLREPASRLFLNRPVEVPGRVHVVRKNLLLAAAALNIGAPDGDLEFPIAIGAEHVAEADAICSQIDGEFAVLNPAGGWVTKLWPARNFGRLADKLWEAYGLRSAIAIGPADSDLGNLALGASRSGRAILVQPSLKGFVELVRRASVYVGGDTGPTHLAVAAGAPVVGLFGPTEWWRNGSLRLEDICVERLDISCRVDCHRRTCSNWICMDIPVEAVLDAVGKRMAVVSPG